MITVHDYVGVINLKAEAEDHVLVSQNERELLTVYF